VNGPGTLQSVFNRNVDAATRDRLHPLQQRRIYVRCLVTHDGDLDWRITRTPAERQAQPTGTANAALVDQLSVWSISSASAALRRTSQSR
jgi:hypothetical protein